MDARFLSGERGVIFPDSLVRIVQEDILSDSVQNEVLQSLHEGEKGGERIISPVAPPSVFAPGGTSTMDQIAIITLPCHLST